MKKLVLILILMVAFSGVSQSENGKDVSIVLHASSKADVDTLSATAFGISLAGSLSKKGDITSEPNGIYKPTYEILVSAFSSQIQIWRELKEKDDPNSQYMNQLISIDDNGYLKEYVWLNHSSKAIADIPPDLRVAEYKEWSVNNLVGHMPRIEARLNLSD